MRILVKKSKLLPSRNIFKNTYKNHQNLIKYQIIKIIMKIKLKTDLVLKRRINMASSKEYLEYILEQLSELDEITYRAMMGEYIIYYRGKIIGGIYDDRFLLKPVKSAKEMLPNANMELPYEEAKEMILVDNVEDKEFLEELVEAMYEELPAPRKRRK